MAVLCRGMDEKETELLTRAMADSGETLGLDAIKRPKADKHSTGGVGDGDHQAALDAGDTALAARLRAETIAMLGVLGLDPAEWAASTEGGAADAVLASLVEHLIGEREAARSTKDFAAADRVRDTLAAAGVVLEDTPTGPKWSI